MFEIKHGAPEPREKYPFRRMQVNDYFDVPAENAGLDGKLVRSAAAWARKKGFGKFAVRKQDGSYRVMRVE